jgi:cell fate (sporulation/competence/biofilm development) regulator YmcA (YheA/YmcA/DUF963 family)
MEKNFMLSAHPSIQKYKHRMDDIKSTIQWIVEVAMIDFLMVSSVFTKYKQAATSSSTEEEPSKISNSVRALQYMDIFSQKLTHITKLNEALDEASLQAPSAAEDRPCDHANFIFKLNHLQSLVAGYDFTLSVSDIKKDLHDLHSHIVEVTQLNFNKSDYFKRIKQIDEQIEKLIILLREMARDRIVESPIHPSVNKQVFKITNLYTMSSERYVLLWLLDNLEAEAHEIMDAYKKIADKREEEVELF